MALRRLTLALLLAACTLPGHARASEAAAEPALDPAALVQLATRYEHAEGLPRDYLRAASRYCSAARAGSAEALVALGWMHANGRGMPVDEGVAGRLFALAAERGHVHAAGLAQRFARPEAVLPPCLSVELETARAPGDPQPFTEDATPVRDLRNVAGARIHRLVVKLAPKYKIDPNLALAIIYMESGFNVMARSPKNAQGLMQLIPETAQRFKVRNPYDAEDNIKGGLAYLRWLLDYFRGDVTLAAAAYNAGEGAVEKHKGVPPFAETRAYVAKLATLYRLIAHPYDGSKAGSIRTAAASPVVVMARQPAR
ncbi:MAG TPA: transglycosylase SLT domain-containing protein [Burkholderiaceae bacterium]